MLSRSIVLRTASRLPPAGRATAASSGRWSALGPRGHLAGVADGQRRAFFGIGEILGVISNPGEVLKSLAESRKLLDEARQEMRESRERAQIPPSHTFNALPGFFDRPREIQAVQRTLAGIPTFTVLFGASSAGKTALLRQVLSSSAFHVLHFDLRIAGFADIGSLYSALANQMERYFAAIPKLMGAGDWGWDSFEKESWAFKHDRLSIEKRVEQGGTVTTADVAHLLELFQSALNAYWEFEPLSPEEREKRAQEEKEKELEGTDKPKHDPKQSDLRKARTVSDEDIAASSETNKGMSSAEAEGDKEETPRPPPKKIPVIFFDEAHKLPALIKSTEAMKSILDSLLVLTKQDRLCHVVHATSDPFYMHWLRQLNIMQHCQILSIGDVSKEEASRFFHDVLLAHVPDDLKAGLSFDEMYKTFGGKLAHLSDFTTEYINSEGKLSPTESSHYIQAYAFLNLHLIHSLPVISDDDEGKPGDGQSDTAANSGAGFRIFSPLSPHAVRSPFTSSASAGGVPGDESAADFTEEQLLSVMRALAPRESSSPGKPRNPRLAYFPLCRELGARVVDGMIRARVLELRWSQAVTPEGDEDDTNVPFVVPTTPVVRFAMGETVREHDNPDHQLARQV